MAEIQGMVKVFTRNLGEAGFRVFFGPQTTSCKQTTARENMDRPASPKIPKIKLENVFSSKIKVTLCIKYALEALQSFARQCAYVESVSVSVCVFWAVCFSYRHACVSKSVRVWCSHCVSTNTCMCCA